MLKKFFMNTLSSFVGAWIALALFGVVAVVVCIGLMARLGASSSTPSVSSHSVLRIDLSDAIVETASTPDFNLGSVMNADFKRPQALNVLVKALEEAAENKNIDAVYIECGGASAGLATLDALRSAVLEFKKSGKKVVAYGDSFTMGDYFVASAADSIFLNHEGSVQLMGITGYVSYMKSLFDKLGISFQIAKVGTFKSAVEPMIMDEMSAPARAQLDTLYGNMWKYITQTVSSDRKKLSPAKINSLINDSSITFRQSGDILRAGLVDALVYSRQVKPRIASIIGRPVEKLNFVSPSTLVDQTDWGMAYSAKDRIALLYASGDIEDGSDSGIDFMKLVPVITELADDDHVKGMVLRVNSPGGSVFGSAEIGEALDYFQSKGKPLAVSMGDYAASGGYWISCCADRIFADPLTITGSIGIFGMFPNIAATTRMVGVNMQMVSTNPQAAFPSLFRPMDERQLAVLQNMVEKGYDKFVGRVAKGRKLSEEKVRAVAEGRVWDAATAVELKLVDQIGGVGNALEWVAGKAGLKKAGNVAVYPRVEASIWDFIPSSSDLAMMALVKNLAPSGIDAEALQAASKILARKPVQARMMEMSVGF